MNRRTLLAASGAVLGGGVAGCFAIQNGANRGWEIMETGFEIVDESGTGPESASVTVEDRTVTVNGTIRGNNGCYTARLAETTIEDDALVVRIESYEDADEDQDCTMAIVYIEYEATVEVHGEGPGSVLVEHNGERVTVEKSV
ncbi:MAG TPA: hypothetical protein VJ898_12820 [Natrialbaceae archaeon]|nr:hypothetical protein [Natrialbaceae archaeon]